MVKKKNKVVIWLLLFCFLAATAVLTNLFLSRMDRYIEENGRENMAAVIEQMEQTYDVQIEKYFSDLQKTEQFLFPGTDRSIETGEMNFHITRPESGEELLFLKDNGVFSLVNGRKSRLEIPSRLLLELEDGKRISKLVSRNNDGKSEDSYLVAIPCEEYFVNGESYTALGILYDRSRIDTLLRMESYGGQALLFLIDEEGNITYTNQTDRRFFRNYSLLKHLKKDHALTDSQLDSLEESFKQKKENVELLGESGKQYYLGYCPIQSSDLMMVCIAAKSVVNNTLLDYQGTLMRSAILFDLVLMLLFAAMLYSASRADIAIQKTVFEEEKQKIQIQAMQALKLERDKAEQASRSKSEFLSNMSHDIRTPMNAIVGITKLMEHDKNDPAKMEMYLHKLQKSSRHLLSLINDVLDMSKIESGEVVLNREPVSIAEQVAQVDSIIRPQVEDRHQNFTIRVHEIIHESFIGDAVRLRQIFINLLSNAVKYTPDGGSIWVDLREHPGKTENDTQIEIAVTDTGCGMTPEFVKHIFEPFMRAENSTISRIQGTGLGMAITKNIVDLMGGTIRIESEPGKGSCFTVTIPFEINKNEDQVLDAKNVLLITDEEMLIRNAEASFGKSGAELFVARTAKEAETLLDKYVMDTILLSGHIHDQKIMELVRFLHEKAKNAVLIFCVDYEQEEEVHEILGKDGVDGLMSRPFFLSNFIHIVNQARRKEIPDAELERSPLNGLKFLCAEDNELNAEILEAILDMNGASCKICPNGQELVKVFEGVKSGDYDAVLLDVQMPVMNGLEAAKAIREGKNLLGRSIPIIAMTANAFSSDVQQCLDAGMDAHVAKPIDIGILERTVKKFVVMRRS